jgi:GH15 family glucan-1,4-alpha-glucosidase
MAEIESYALIGNKRTAALVGRDGAIDWLCPRRFDGPSAFAALLDEERGGTFALRPEDDGFTVTRRYLPRTNVLETTFATAEGEVRVVDALALPTGGLDYNQVIRRIEGASGSVRMRWRVAPRFGYGARGGQARRLGGVPVIADGDELVLAVNAHGCGEPVVADGEVHGAFTIDAGERAHLALSSFDSGPLAFSSEQQLATRVDRTIEHWEHWARDCPEVEGCEDACERSLLALDLMVHGATGGIVAAPTLGLPEQDGGDRNYDYRYVWLRDSNLTLEAMLRMGLADQVHASLRWMFQATERTHPWLSPVFTTAGTAVPDEQELGALRGFGGAAPVKLGNRAADQLQLGCYGDVFDMVWLYVRVGNGLADEAAARLAGLADFVCRVWDRPDSGLWELPQRRRFTQSSLACALALHRAIALAEAGWLPAAGVPRWRAAHERIREHVHGACWDPVRRAYKQAADGDELDAAILLAARGGILLEEPERLSSTIDALRAELGAGDGSPLLWRTTSLKGREGAFLACSFWMAEALARVGRLDEAQSMLKDLVALGNDVGLLAEEVDPASGAFRGNFPQALTHLALINAADVCARLAAGRPADPGDEEDGQDA